MGSPLGPLFANIFMSSHVKSWLYNCPSAFKPLLYRCYVDDCFLLFKSFDHVPLLLTILTTSILTSPSLPSWKKTASFLSLTLRYLAQTVNFRPLFIVNPLSLVFSLTSIALFLLLTNAPWFFVYFTEFLIFVPIMKTSTLNLRLSGNCLT